MNAALLVWPVGLLIVPVISTLYDIVAYVALRKWMNEPAEKATAADEPITFFRPLKSGVPNLQDKLTALIEASDSGDQILLGVEANSEEEAICEEVRKAFPARDASIVRCAPNRAPNPKISKLVQMAPLARHSNWLLSDSEMIVAPDFLKRLRNEWQTKECAALTTPYRFVNARTWPQRCDALGVMLGLWPGVALIRRYAEIDFTLGACTLFRREALMAIGSWEAFGHELAEDNRLGGALVRSGQRVRMSRHVATLESDPISWRDYWRHQRRVAVTYRAVNPLGFAGVLLTFGPVWSLLCLLAFPQPWFWLALGITHLSRVWRLWATLRLMQSDASGFVAASWIAHFVEPACWVSSWFSRRVWWSGRWWRVGFRGALSPFE